MSSRPSIQSAKRDIEHMPRVIGNESTSLQADGKAVYGKIAKFKQLDVGSRKTSIDDSYETRPKLATAVAPKYWARRASCVAVRK